MIKKTIIGFGLFIIIFLVYVALLPSEMHISRELEMKATSNIVFPHINNSEKANAWMPWSESDPDVKTTYSGPSEGMGSKSSWTSTGKMGVGEAIIIESFYNFRVKTKLTYTKPMEMTQIATITLTRTPNETTIVRWEVSGQNNFLGRLFCVFMNMDKMVGGEFEKGLAKLKSIVETPR